MGWDVKFPEPSTLASSCSASLQHNLDPQLPLPRSAPHTAHHTTPHTQARAWAWGIPIPALAPCSQPKSNGQTAGAEGWTGIPNSGEGRLQTRVSEHQTRVSEGLEFLQNQQPHTSLLSLPASPLTLSVSSKSGRLGPGVGITGGAGGLRGRARTQKHW